MKIGKYVLIDKYGWPVVSIAGKQITNTIRAIIHTNIYKTLLYNKEVN